MSKLPLDPGFRCSKHKGYRGSRPAKRDCDGCHIVWLQQELHRVAMMVHWLRDAEDRHRMEYY